MCLIYFFIAMFTTYLASILDYLLKSLMCVSSPYAILDFHNKSFLIFNFDWSTFLLKLNHPSSILTYLLDNYLVASHICSKNYSCPRLMQLPTTLFNLLLNYIFYSFFINFCQFILRVNFFFFMFILKVVIISLWSLVALISLETWQFLLLTQCYNY